MLPSVLTDFMLREYWGVVRLPDTSFLSHFQMPAPSVMWQQWTDFFLQDSMRLYSSFCWLLLLLRLTLTTDVPCVSSLPVPMLLLCGICVLSSESYVIGVPFLGLLKRQIKIQLHFFHLFTLH